MQKVDQFLFSSWSFSQFVVIGEPGNSFPVSLVFTENFKLGADASPYSRNPSLSVLETLSNEVGGRW